MINHAFQPAAFVLFFKKKTTTELAQIQPLLEVFSLYFSSWSVKAEKVTVYTHVARGWELTNKPQLLST